MDIGAKLRARGATKLWKEPLIDWREDGRGGRWRFLRAGRSEDGGTGDELGGRSEPRAEKMRAQDEPEAKGAAHKKKEQADGKRATLEGDTPGLTAEGGDRDFSPGQGGPGPVFRLSRPDSQAMWQYGYLYN